jgi:long-chain fatty acid transport protein
MRKAMRGLAVLLLVAALAASAQAGGIINKQNLSADYIRTLNRNAATDMADAAAYNPAGTAMMEDGLYLKADVIYLYKDYQNHLPQRFGPGNVFNAGGGTVDSEEPSIIPGLFAVYKQDRWSVFFDVTVPGGGGKVRYDDGDSRTMALAANYRALIGTGFDPASANQFIEADSYYVGYSLGAAYKVFDSLSLSGGVRYVDAYQKFKGYAKNPTNPAQSVNVKIERTDEAFNYFLGLDYSPIKDLNIGLTYMSNTPLNFKSNTKDSTAFLGPNSISAQVGWQDGTHEREDLPGYIGLGVSYFLIPGTLRLEPNLTYYLEKQAKLEGQRFQDSEPGNSYDIGLTLEYIVNPQWRFSIGYLHTEIKGMQAQDLLTEAPELDANTIALGLVWSPVERLSITLSGLRTWYDARKTDVTNSRGVAGSEYDKDVYGMALGLQYRFF